LFIGDGSPGLVTCHWDLPPPHHRIFRKGVTSMSRSVVSSGGVGVWLQAAFGGRVDRPGGRGARRGGAPDQPTHEAGRFGLGAIVSGDCRSTVYPHSWWPFFGPVHGWSRSAGGAPIGHAGLATAKVSPSLAQVTRRSRPSALVSPVLTGSLVVVPVSSVRHPRHVGVASASPLAACRSSTPLMPLSQ
jgi:hypothetical protein